MDLSGRRCLILVATSLSSPAYHVLTWKIEDTTMLMRL